MKEREVKGEEVNGQGGKEGCPGPTRGRPKQKRLPNFINLPAFKNHKQL